MLASEVRAALYVARSADCGLQPSQSGARQLDAEIAAAAQRREGSSAAQPVSPSSADADATAGELNLPSLRLGPRSAAILARGVSRPTAINLHNNPNLTDAGAQALLSLLENGTVRVIDLGVCGLANSFAPALARYLLRTDGSGDSLVTWSSAAPPPATCRSPTTSAASRCSRRCCSSCPKLARLGLSHAALERARRRRLCAPLRRSPIRSSHLSVLDLAANAFGRDLTPLLELVPLCDALTELDVSANELHDWGADALAASLCAAGAGASPSSRKPPPRTCRRRRAPDRRRPEPCARVAPRTLSAGPLESDRRARRARARRRLAARASPPPTSPRFDEGVQLMLVGAVKADQGVRERSRGSDNRGRHGARRDDVDGEGTRWRAEAGVPNLKRYATTAATRRPRAVWRRASRGRRVGLSVRGAQCVSAVQRGQLRCARLARVLWQPPPRRRCGACGARSPTSHARAALPRAARTPLAVPSQRKARAVPRGVGLARVLRARARAAARAARRVARAFVHGDGDIVDPAYFRGSRQGAGRSDPRALGGGAGRRCTLEVAARQRRRQSASRATGEPRQLRGRPPRKDTPKLIVRGVEYGSTTPRAQSAQPARGRPIAR